MMTKQEELQRYYEDRDMLENDMELDGERMKVLEQQEDYEDSEEWNELWDAVNAATNEIAGLTVAIEELEEELGVSQE